MSMEDVERILDETQESVEYQRVLLKKPKCLEQQNYPFYGDGWVSSALKWFHRRDASVCPPFG